MNKHVLVPRPETEAMIELLKQLPLPARSTIADVGTGSGCVGITAALELPGAHVTLYDIDPDALEVARGNAAELGADVEEVEHDLLSDTAAHYDVVLANLPYVPDGHPINRAAGYEPAHALFSGADGLDLYRLFWDQVRTLKPSYVLTESLQEQHKEIADLAHEAGYRPEKTEGLIQLFTARALPRA